MISERQRELRELWLESLGNVRQQHLDWFLGNGVSGPAFVASGVVGVLWGRLGRDYFDVLEPGDLGGRQLFVQSVIENGTRIDLVAWAPSDPANWRLLNGLGAGLGHDEIISAEVDDRALWVHSKPLEWMRAGGQGCCPLVWHQAVLGAWGWGFITKYLTSDAAFGERLDALLTAPKHHSVRVQRQLVTA